LQQPLFRIVQQVVTPVDQRAQCLLAWQRRSRAARQQSETLVQLAVDLFERKVPRPRCRQLNGQRDAVQSVADGGERRSVLVGDLKIRAGEQGPIGEQLHRIERRDRGCSMRMRRIRQRKRGHAVRLLATDAKRFPAAGKNRQERALPQQRVDQLEAVLEQVFTVVEEQQESPVLELPGERLLD
jgi:hypothetical protein